MEVQENKMGTMPIGKLLFTISFPIMISMLIQAMYNIVDSYFVGKISEEAFTALSISFPLQNLMIGIAVGTAVGMNSNLSKFLGEKDFEKSDLAAENGLFLSLLYGIIFFVLSFFLPEIFFRSQSDDPLIIQHGVEYLTLVMRFSIGVFVQIIAERMLSSTGRTFFTMITQAVGAIINIILDPIFIFGYFGFPAMGVRGAAIATLCGQIIGAVVGMLINFFLNKEITLKRIRPDFNMIRHIYKIGIPSIIMMTITSTTMYLFNGILYRFSSTAVAVKGAENRLQSFVWMPIFGLNNGMVPIVAYNYGAKHEERIKKTIKCAILFSVSIMSVGTLIFQFFPAQLLGIFSASDEMLEIGIPALRRVSLAFIPAGISIICSSVFQALGNGILALIDSILRQFLILLPFAYFFSLSGNVDNVWWGYLVAEISSVIYVSYYMKNFALKKIEGLEKRKRKEIGKDVDK